ARYASDLQEDPVPPPSRLDAKGMAVVVCLCAIWGANQVAVKVGNSGLAPIFASAVRSVIAGALVAGWCLLSRTPLWHRDRTALHGLVLGIIFGVEFMLIYVGLNHTTASRGVLFLYAAPFFVAAGAHWLLPQEPLTRRKLLGLCLAFAGLVATFADRLQGPSTGRLLGDLLLLGGGALWAAATLYLKGIVGDRMTPAQMLFYQLAVSAILLLLGALSWEDPLVFDPRPTVLWAVLYQSVIVAFASYLVWFSLLSRYPASGLSGFTFFTPLFGVLAGALLLREPLGPGLLLGAALVSTGMVLVNRPAPGPSLP
ncbi:MAG: DMT family transporter, partial [candidate division NC10 bacterium]